MDRPEDVLAAQEAERTRSRRVTVILNPASGRGQGQRRRSELELLLDREVGRSPIQPASWSIVETDAPGHAAVLAAEASAQGADVVAAAGGDGTYGEVVNGLVGSGAALSILPLGTGNDFARGLGLGTSLERSVQTLFQGKAMPVDLGRARDRWFINAAGCGLDAVVADRVNTGFRRLHGTAAYVAALAQSLLTFKAAQFRLTLDGQVLDVRAMLCTVANSSSYGGGMRIAPDARMDDGLLDVCVLKEAGRLELLIAFPRVFRGTHVTHPKVTMLQARAVLVESTPPMPVLIDGDVDGVTPVLFAIHPHAIRVIMPATAR